MDADYYILIGLGSAIAVIVLYIVYKTSGKAFIKSRDERDKSVGYTPWELDSEIEGQDKVKPESATRDELSTEEATANFFSMRTPSWVWFIIFAVIVSIPIISRLAVFNAYLDRATLPSTELLYVPQIACLSTGIFILVFLYTKYRIDFW